MPSMVKHQASPKAAMMKPPMAGPMQAGGVEHGGVEGDGVGEDGAVLDHFDEEGLAGGGIKGVDDALGDAEQGDLPDVDASAEGEHGEGEGLQHGEVLGPDQGAVPVPAIDPDPGKGAEEKGRDLSEEGDEAEHPGRAGEAVDQPAGGDAGHPGADEREALAAEEEAVVAASEGAQEESPAGGGLCRGRHGQLIG